MLPIAHFACLFVIIFVAPGNNLLTHHAMYRMGDDKKSSSYFRKWKAYADD